MSEKDICIMESEMNAAVDEYIAARPQLDSIHNRRIYESGFKAGYGKLESANSDLQRRLDYSEKHRKLLIGAINMAIEELPVFAAKSQIHKDISEGIGRLLNSILVYKGKD